MDFPIWEVVNAARIQRGAVDSFQRRNLKQNCIYWAALKQKS